MSECVCVCVPASLPLCVCVVDACVVGGRYRDSDAVLFLLVLQILRSDQSLDV